MDDSGIGLEPLVGWGLTVLAIVGGVILRDRQVMQSINEGDNKIHDRLSKVKDEYVRRDDLHSQINRIEKSMDEMKDEMREQRRVNEMTATTLMGHTSTLQAMLAILTEQGKRGLPPAS